MAKRSDVGYRRPPKETQFKRGESGNPSGRPKATVNMTTALTRTLSEPVEVEAEDGNTVTITKMEAAVKRLVDEAINGDMHAFRVLSVLTQVLQNPAGDDSENIEGTDREVMQSLLRRFAAASRS
jgi:hypothetical protein